MKAVSKRCIGCGVIFQDRSYNSSARYCSDTCRRNNYVRRTNQKVQSICDFCGIIYYKKFIHQRYCSSLCSKAKQFEQLLAKHHPWQKLRFLAFQRDNFTCKYCGRNVQDDHIKLVIDHLEPRHSGGRDSLDNYITACVECNSGKSDFCLSQTQIIKLKSGIQITSDDNVN